MDTDGLIRTLAADAAVRRLPHPMVRAAIWLALSAGYVAGVVLAFRLFGTPVAVTGDRQFVIEQVATIATALMAAIAAFSCIVPGRSRMIALAPLVPLAVWLASMGETCLKTWNLLVSGDVGLEGGWDCLPPSVLIGLGPAIVILAMLRRGAPLYPRSTIALAALAVAALGNLGLRLFHEGDVTVMMLAWQLGAMMLVVGLGGLLAPRLLGWHLTRLGVANRA